MAKTSKKIDVYIETGSKRTFANAVDWPGWSRVGRDEDSALAALLDSAPRYAKILKAARIAFDAPEDVSDFHIVDRVKGGTTTDFGAPEAITSRDEAALDGDELKRLEKLLRAYWRAFDAATEAAEGKELAKGPRGGGRDLDKIIDHVLGADSGYLGSLAWKKKKIESKDQQAQLEHTREMILEALTASAHGQLPKERPRGGKGWPARYFVRRSGWHVLDHIWEIEDRIHDDE